MCNGAICALVIRPHLNQGLIFKFVNICQENFHFLLIIALFKIWKYLVLIDSSSEIWNIATGALTPCGPNVAKHLRLGFKAYLLTLVTVLNWDSGQVKHRVILGRHLSYFSVFSRALLTIVGTTHAVRSACSQIQCKASATAHKRLKAWVLQIAASSGISYTFQPCTFMSLP